MVDAATKSIFAVGIYSKVLNIVGPSCEGLAEFLIVV